MFVNPIVLKELKRIVDDSEVSGCGHRVFADATGRAETGSQIPHRRRRRPRR